MKHTKKLAALLLAATTLALCAACGGSAKQDAQDAGDAGESSPLMQAVYDKLVGGAAYAEVQETYADLARFDAKLKGDAIELSATAENEWYETMNGAWDYVLDGDYITFIAGQEEYTGMMLFSTVCDAVADYLGMDTELASMYRNAVSAANIPNAYFIVKSDETAGTITEKIYVAGAYDMDAVLDTTYITQSQIDYVEPMNDEDRNVVANAGKVSMSAVGTKDAADIYFAEYGGVTELTYQSMREVVQVLQPTGYEEFLADYDALAEVTTARYQVVFLTDGDELPYAFEDYGDNYQFIKVHFGD